jgi:hypothetical protein
MYVINERTYYLFHLAHNYRLFLILQTLAVIIRTAGLNAKTGVANPQATCDATICIMLGGFCCNCRVCNQNLEGYDAVL